MATQLAQRISTGSTLAAAQKKAAAPRAPFSSPILAQLKQVPRLEQFSWDFALGTPSRSANFLCVPAECQRHLCLPADSCSALREGTGTSVQALQQQKQQTLTSCTCS